MKILVPTSNKYAELTIPFAELYNKYWPGQEIYFLGYDVMPSKSLPDNCTFVSLGNQDDFGKTWTNALIPYIQALPDTHFIVTMEDVALVDYVDQHLVDKLENEIKSGHAKKALLDSHLNHMSITYKEGLRQLHPAADYRTTLHPAIWEKDYFLRYLKPNFSAWDFEVKNMPESKVDGERVISLDQVEFMYKISNIYSKGIPFPRYQDRLQWGSTGGILKEDIMLIYAYLPEPLNLKKDTMLRLEKELVDTVRYH